MARPPRNTLTIRIVSGGLFQLTGRFKGERIRIRSQDFDDLEAKRLDYEQLLLAPPARTQSLRMTRLTEAQLRDAEAAVERAGERSLLACVIASDRVMVTGDPVPLSTALTDWLERQESRGRYERTIEGNMGRARAFIAEMASLGVHSVGEVRPEHFETWIYRGKRADYTRKGDASVLQAWANHWIMRKWVKESPFEVDMRDLKTRARAMELPRILTPEQAHALLAAANARGGARMAAYVALSCWCFARHAEVMRVTPTDMRFDGKVPVVEIRPRKRGTVSYRTVTVPACVLDILKAAKAEAVQAGSEFVASYGRVRFDGVREAAGLAERGKTKNKKRPVVSAVWQENILRHTGLSYLFQQTGDMKEVTRQAGNSSATAFAHYLNLPIEGASDAFFG